MTWFSFTARTEACSPHRPSRQAIPKAYPQPKESASPAPCLHLRWCFHRRARPGNQRPLPPSALLFPSASLKQSSLLTRPSELGTIHAEPFMLQAVFFSIGMILVVHHFSNAAFPAHAHAPAAVVHFSIMTSFDHMPDLVGAVGKIFIQPVVKKQFDRAIQPDEGIGRKAGTGFARGLNDGGHFVLVQSRDHRPEHHAHLHAGLAQFFDGAQSLPGRGGARLPHPPQG